MSHETIQMLLIRNEREETRPATGDEILRAARDVMNRRVRRGTSMSSPQVVRDFLSVKLGMLEHETFCVMFLDSRHKLIEFVELFRGTVDGASVYPREVVKLALAKNATAVVCAHPHPSGVAEPSHADEMITRRLREALGLVDIRLLDHLLGGFQFVLRAMQLLKRTGFCCNNQSNWNAGAYGDRFGRKLTYHQRSQSDLADGTEQRCNSSVRV